MSGLYGGMEPSGMGFSNLDASYAATSQNQLAPIVGPDHTLHPTKARVSRGLQDLLIDLKEMKADNRRLEDLLRGEQAERQGESQAYMKARQGSELQIKDMEDEMRQCLQELKWAQLELKRAITTSHEASRPPSSFADLDNPDAAIGWNLAGDIMIDDENNPAKQVHHNIKGVNDLAKRTKEEVQSLVGLNADLKWEKGKAEVTAKAYCTELLTCKKNNATKKMRAQLCRWRHLRIAKGFSTWVYWHTALAKEMVRRKRTLLEEDVLMLTAERDRLLYNLDMTTGQKEAHEGRCSVLEDLLKAAGGFTDDDFASMPAGGFGGASDAPPAVTTSPGGTTHSAPAPAAQAGPDAATLAADFKEKAAERIRQSQAAEAMKRLTTHLKFKNYALGVRVFVAWANHMRALENFKAMEFMRHEKEKFETADKEAKKGAKGQEAASAAMKGAQEEGKVRYYQASIRRETIRRRFGAWVELLFQSRIRRTEELLQMEFEQRVSSEQSRHDLERELEEIYLSKARAEAEREEAMGALRQHREKEELDMNRLLEEVGYLKAEVYAT